MSMFPGAGASVYYNEDGEPLGWDYPSYDDAPDVDDFYDRDEPDEDEGEDCENCNGQGWVRYGAGENLTTSPCSVCHSTGKVLDESDPMEDQWLDGYMEDRLTTLYEG